MKRIVLFFLLALMTCKTFAQNTVFRTESLEIAVDEEGFFASIRVCGNEILMGYNYPFVMACKDGRLAVPNRFAPAYGTLYEIGFDDGGAVLVAICEMDNYLKIMLELNHRPRVVPRNILNHADIRRRASCDSERKNR